MGRIIDSKTWRICEIILMRYPEQKKELAELLDDIVYSKGSGSGSTNFDQEYSKPQSVTESKALKLNSGYYQRLKRQVSAVESAYNNLNDEEKKVIAKRYWEDPNQKISYLYIDCAYSERQMKRIVFKVIYHIGLQIGEIERKDK